MSNRMHPEDLRALMAAIITPPVYPHLNPIKAADNMLAELARTATVTPGAWTDARVAPQLSLAHARNVITYLEHQLETAKAEGARQERERIFKLLDIDGPNNWAVVDYTRQGIPTEAAVFGAALRDILEPK